MKSLQKNFFVKSHGLGNAYIVLDSALLDFKLTPPNIKQLCNMRYGIGSDGILVKTESKIADFGLIIYNTDASIAENCGNGLRIFSKFLYDYGYTSQKDFTVDILGRLIHCTIKETKNNKAHIIKVHMGKANFASKFIPVLHAEPECIRHTITIDSKEIEINCVSVGNPHCVVVRNELLQEELLHFGPLIETASIFPQRTNVQFVKPIDKHNVEIRIWERGVGNTLASGSSSCAVASVMVKNGLADSPVTVTMPGGTLLIEITPEWDIYMTGPAVEVIAGTVQI